MQKSIWLFGGIAGVLSAVLEYFYYTGQSLDSKTMFLAKIAILVVCVVFALVLIKKLIGGTISIGRTILSGVLIGVVRSLITSIVFLVLYLPNGEFYQPHIDSAMEQAEVIVLEDENIEAEDKAENIEEARQRIQLNFRPTGYAFFSLLGSVVTAFVVSILLAAFIATNMMYKDPSPQE